MTAPTADVVICGAGIAGIAAAYHLAVRRRVGRVVLVDERPPLSLTSDKSTEAYRNWWPGPDDAMVRYMNRSIDILEELAEASGNIFRMNRRGYAFATADPSRAAALGRAGELAAAHGAGAFRHHVTGPGTSDYRPAVAEAYQDQPDGSDLVQDPDLIRRHFPALSEDTVAVLHARRCGWLSGQQLGMYQLEESRRHGVTLYPGRLEAIDAPGGRVTGVRVAGPGGTRTVSTPAVVLAGGPFLADVAGLLEVELPVFCERHFKLALEDVKGVVPRDAPFLIWDDPQTLAWDEEVRAELAASPTTRFMTEAMPPGAHFRPEGAGADSRTLLVLWSYHEDRVTPVFPMPEDPHFPELALRGVARMVPGLAAYLDPLPRVYVDGGYYTKTRENRPLVGPLLVKGAFVAGAFSGFGIMASSAGGELVAAHVTGATLPEYAPAFHPARYDDPAYVSLLDAWGDTGQI